MAITNQSKPTTSLTNNSKVSIGETWSSITSSWATESRTWLAVSQLFTNFIKPVATGGTIGAGIKYMGFIMQYSEEISVPSNTMTNLPKP